MSAKCTPKNDLVYHSTRAPGRGSRSSGAPPGRGRRGVAKPSRAKRRGGRKAAADFCSGERDDGGTRGKPQRFASTMARFCFHPPVILLLGAIMSHFLLPAADAQGIESAMGRYIKLGLGGHFTEHFS